MSILIVGGAGYIGSHANKCLNAHGYDTIIIDNLSYGHAENVRWGRFVQGDIGDRQFLDNFFRTEKIEAVMHFAAFAYVGESVVDPAKYYDNNVVRTLVLLDTMREHHVNHFVFSSSCATFGNAVYTPIDEKHPQSPVNPYGQTKLIVEHILQDYDRAYGLKHCIFRYFNAAGASPDAEIGEWHEPETHLIPLVLDAAAGKREAIQVFGADYPTPDGTCVRDYIHVSDLAEAHRLGMERMLRHNVSDHFNLGFSKGYSIREVIETAKRITGKPIQVRDVDRRAGDPPVLVGACGKAQEILQWVPKYSLEDSIESAWKWHEQELNRRNAVKPTEKR